MLVQTMKILTEEESRLIVKALGWIATEEHCTKEEIATIRKILRSLERKEPKKSEFDGTRSRILADICLIPNWA